MRNLIISLVALGLAATTAQATPYYYDNNSDTAGFGTAGGTWAAPTPGATPGWSTSAAGDAFPGSVTTTTGDVLNFGNGATGLGAGTITVSGTVNAGNMTFASGSGAIVLSGGSITLADDETITVNNTANTISSILGGAATSLTKAGTGTLTLSGNNTYSGGTTIGGGEIKASHNSALGSGAVVIDAVSGNQLQLAAGIDIGNSLTIHGGGVLGQGALWAENNAAAIYSGSISIDALPNSGGHFAAGTGTSTLTLTGPISSTVTVYIRKGSVIFSNDGSSYTTLSIQGGTAKLGMDNAIPVGAAVNIGVSGDAYLDLAGYNQTLAGMTKSANAATIGNSSTTTDSLLTTTGTSTFAGQIVDVIGSGNKKVALTVNGGELTLSGTNTFTGGVTLQNGKLVINQAGVAGVSGALGNGGTFIINGGTVDTVAGGIVNSNANPLTINADFTFTGTGALNLGTGATTLGTAAGSSRMITVSASTLTLGGVIANGTTANGLTKAGGGVLQLTGLNTYTGDTFINGGQLVIGSTINTSLPGSLGNGNYAGNIYIASGALLAFRSNRTQTFRGVISGDGSMFVGGGGALTLSGTNTFTGPIQVGGTGNGLSGSLTVSSFNYITTGTWTDHLIGSSLGIPTTVNNGKITLGAGLSANVALTYTGSGETTDRTLNFVNINAGTRYVTLDNSGTGLLKFTTTPTGVTLVNSIVLQGGNDGELVGGLPFSFPKLTKSGTGTWTLGGAVGNTGLLTINAGTLALQKKSSLMNGNTANWTAALINVKSGATLAVNVDSAETAGLNSTSLDTLLAAISVAGTTVQGLQSGAKLALDTSTATGGTFTQGNIIADSTGASGGAIHLTKLGAGTLVLDKANTYTGSTTVEGDGTLNLTGNRTAAAGSIIVKGGSTLGISNGSFSLGANAFSVGSGTGSAGNGTVNHTAGSISTGNGGQVLVGNGTSTGIYNLSGGTLTTFVSLTRGVMLGVNAGSTGTFNLSGSGSLQMTSGGNSILQIGRSDSAVHNTTALFYQTGGTADIGTLAMGGAAGGATNVNSTLTLPDGTFTASAFTLLAAGDSNTAVINIGGTADVTLPNLPTARGSGATATMNFDGGTLKNSATGTFITGLNNAFIQSGGATFDTSLNSTTISQALLTHGSSTGGGLTKDGVNTLTLSGVNTYTGDTTVNAGTLKLTTTGSIADSASILLASGAGFDVSTLTTPLALSAGQTLRGTATGGTPTATITLDAGKGLTLSDAGVAFTAFGAGTTPPLTVAGSGGSLDMNDAPVSINTSPLTEGAYRLIAKSGSASVAGSVSSSSLTINGEANPQGYALAIIGGELMLTVKQGTVFRFR